MKKSLVALAVLGTVAGTASAQSSVTLFGVLDTGIRMVKTGGRSMDLIAADGQQTSRVGLRGVEDLGGGLKASFFLDSQLAGDTGVAGDTSFTPNKFWNRRSTVSLSGDFGEVRLGRDKTSVRNLIDEADAFGTVGLGAVTSVSANVLGLTTGAGYTIGNNRNDNQFRYFLPSGLGGIYGSVDMGYGENVNGQKFYGGRVGYKEGALNLSVGMQVSKLFNGASWGMGAISGSYDFGVVKLTVFGIETKYNGRKQDSYSVNAQVPMGQGLLKVQYTNSNANAAAAAVAVDDASLISASYAYNLSKRTQVYSTVSVLKNKGVSRFALGTAPAATANGQNSGGLDLGITHMF